MNFEAHQAGRNFEILHIISYNEIIVSAFMLLEHLVTTSSNAFDPFLSFLFMMASKLKSNRISLQIVTI